jgi:hypothetical protein
VFTGRADNVSMASSRPARPVRRLFGLVATAVAASDLAVATAVEGNHLGIPTVPEASQVPMLAYGGLLLAIGLWSVATSFGSHRSKAAASDTTGGRGGHERRIVRALRERGWYVADDVVLPHAHIDHVAVGPAGVLAIQTRWTNRTDPRGKPSVRARIGAQQLHQALAQRELDVEVVPAVLTFGPGLTKEPGGVKVVDAVALLNGYQADDWLEQLDQRVLLSDHLVDATREAVGDLLEGTVPASPAIAPKATNPRQPALVH